MGLRHTIGKYTVGKKSYKQAIREHGNMLDSVQDAYRGEVAHNYPSAYGPKMAAFNKNNYSHAKTARDHHLEIAHSYGLHPEHDEKWKAHEASLGVAAHYVPGTKPPADKGDEW
jgi:hypothetical protein